MTSPNPLDGAKMTDEQWDAECLDAAIQDFSTVVIMAQNPSHGGMRKELKQTRERIHEIARALLSASKPAAPADDVIDLAIALEQKRALHIVAAVRKQGFAKSADAIPTQAESVFDLACEEIEHRLRTEVWEIDGVDSPLPAAPAQSGEAVADVPEGCTVADAKMLREANHALTAENELLRKRLRPFAHLVGIGELSWAMVEYCVKDDPEKQTFQAPQMQRALNRAAEAYHNAAPQPTQPAEGGDQLAALHKELNRITWMGADEGWDRAIEAVRKRITKMLEGK